MINTQNRTLKSNYLLIKTKTKTIFFFFLILGVDIVFCPPSICVPNLENFKILYFLRGVVETSRLTWRNSFKYQSTRSAISGQINQNALGQPWVGRKSKSVKIIEKQHFSCFYIKPELLSDFRQLWPSLTRGWLPKRTLETLIYIWLLEWVGTNAIAKIINFPFQRLFMGRNRR